MIVRKRRKQSQQSGYVSKRRIGDREVWIGNYDLWPRDAETGKPKRVHHTIKDPLGKVGKMTIEQARKQCARLVLNLTKQGAKRDARVSFRDFTEEEFLPKTDPRWAVESRKTRNGDLANCIYPHIGTLSLEEITLDVLTEFINKLGADGLDYSKSVVKRVKTLVSSILEEAVVAGLLLGNPARSMSFKLPKCTKRAKPKATRAEIGLFLRELGALPTSDKHPHARRDFVVMKLAQQGAIASEIFAIQIDAVHIDDTTLELTMDDFIEIRNSTYHGRLRLNETKTEARERKLWIDSKETKVALLRLLETVERDPKKNPHGMLFPSRLHGKTLWSGTYLKKQIRPLALKWGISTPITFQVLRRTFATWNDDLGLDQLRSVQRIMGHTDGSEVTRRVYVQQLDVRDAALVREYARICEEEATKSIAKQQRKKVTRDELVAFEIERVRAASGAIQ